MLLGWDFLTLSIMQHHDHRLDTLMVFVTQWAEWPIIVISLLLSVYVWKRSSWFWWIAFAVEGIVVQFIKLSLNWPRPASKFPDMVRTINGIPLSKWQAFPSGHTAAAFFATCLILSLWKTQWNFYFKHLLVILAFAVAYSRVYLGQHSIEDVLFGALCGIWIFALSHYIFRTKIIKVP
jgi:membrane-associated phospholipid phosphatase